MRLVGLAKQAGFLLANWQTTRETYDLMIHIKTGVENMNLKILCPTVACGMFAHGGQHVRARSKLPLQRRTMVQNVALCMRQIVFYDGAIWACMGRGVPCRHTGNGGLGFRPLPKRVSRVGNQSIRHWLWHALAKVKLTVKIQRGRYWDDWYVSPFPSFLSLCIFHAQCVILL